MVVGGLDADDFAAEPLAPTRLGALTACKTTKSLDERPPAGTLSVEPAQQQPPDLGRRSISSYLDAPRVAGHEAAAPEPVELDGRARAQHLDKSDGGASIRGAGPGQL